MTTMQHQEPQLLERGHRPNGHLRRSTLRPDAVIRQALGVLLTPLRGFVEAKMQSRYGDDWRAVALGAMHTVPALAATRREHLETDIGALLLVVTRFGAAVFNQGSPRFAQNLFHELRQFRNGLAHGETFGIADAFRATDSVHRALEAIGHDDRHQTEKARERMLHVWLAAIAHERQQARSRYPDNPTAAVGLQASPEVGASQNGGPK